MERASILIIDDDPGLRRTLADILRVKGYEPLAAGDGTEGVAKLRENDVNVALVDLGLPDASGIDILSRGRVRCNYSAPAHNTPCPPLNLRGGTKIATSAAPLRVVS